MLCSDLEQNDTSIVPPPQAEPEAGVANMSKIDEQETRIGLPPSPAPEEDKFHGRDGSDVQELVSDNTKTNEFQEATTWRAQEEEETNELGAIAQDRITSDDVNNHNIDQFQDKNPNQPRARSRRTVAPTRPQIDFAHKGWMRLREVNSPEGLEMSQIDSAVGGLVVVDAPDADKKDDVAGPSDEQAGLGEQVLNPGPENVNVVPIVPEHEQDQDDDEIEREQRLE
ncbi:unnamed protein product [Amoebophrya sp. A25]|nr:unnamed protein product [Amoebophrya sp. A25]|eukprot:GSA25T00014976001.1